MPIWLAKVAERGMCRPSLVHPPEIRRLRDLTRYRRSPGPGAAPASSSGWRRLLEDAQIKLDSAVLANLHGVSPGGTMLQAMIAGQREPSGAGPSWPARPCARKKPARLRRGADAGHFD